MVNVLCIKWGNLYGPEYVNKLYRMVSRHLNQPFRFVCLTDNTDGLLPQVETLPIPAMDIPAHRAVSPWRKLTLFSEQLGDLQGKALFLDLDVVILDSIDPLFEYADRFTIIENWTQKGRNIGNSSVYAFEIGRYAHVLEHYRTHQSEVLERFRNEQMYLSWKIGDLKFWPRQWCQSFKFHSIPPWPQRLWKSPQIPSECRILVFHGHPNPDEALAGNYRGKWRKYFKPAKWIADYWF